MEVSSLFQERYNALFQKIEEASKHQPLYGGSDLHESAVKLFTEVAEAKRSNDLTFQCRSLLNRFVFPVKAPSQGDNLEAIRTIYANKNQYSDGNNSSCTSCAQAFLRNVLPLGIAWDLTPGQVTSFIDMGKGLYFALLEEAKGHMTGHNKDLGGSHILYEAFSAHDIAQQYDLRIVRDHPERVLEVDPGNGTTASFFEKQLEQLEGELSGDKKKIGATIHCQGKTYALAIFNTPHGREYVFFDSHGNTEVNHGNSHAYVKYTFSKEAMARTLSEVMPFAFVEESAQIGMKKDDIAKIERDNNGFILYQMDLTESGLLAIADDDGQESNRSPHLACSHKGEKTSHLSKLVLTGVAITFFGFRKQLISWVRSYGGTIES